MIAALAVKQPIAYNKMSGMKLLVQKQLGTIKAKSLVVGEIVTYATSIIAKYAWVSGFIVLERSEIDEQITIMYLHGFFQPVKFRNFEHFDSVFNTVIRTKLL